MYRFKGVIHILVFILIVFISFGDQIYNPFTTPHLNQLPYETDVAMKENNPLYEEIVHKAENYEEEPENAYIDRVWKKIPGRNGIKVDIDASYEQMNKNGVFDTSLLVYEQIPPDVTYKDLPAAPVYRGHPDKNMIGLLINVSWGENHIPGILRILKKHNVKATFFIEGKWAKEHVAYVEMIDEEGHLIGNHAYSHPDMARITPQQTIEEIQKTNDVLKAITNQKPEWFAPPSGSFNNQVVEAAHELNMETVLWSVDTIDWKNPTPSVMMNRVMSNVHKGATILMHPTPVIEQGLDLLITDLKKNDYKLGTIEQLLNEKR